MRTEVSNSFFLNAFGSAWAQVQAGTFRFRAPLNQVRCFIPLRLDDAPIKGSRAQFLSFRSLTAPVSRVRIRP